MKDEWETPPELIKYLEDTYGILIDACSTPLNSKCPARFRDIFEINSEADLDYEVQDDLGIYAYDVGYQLDDIYETIHYDNTDAVDEAQCERIVENYKNEFSIFMNPPFSDIGKYIQQAWKISQWMPVICLLPLQSLSCRYLDFLDELGGKGETRQWNKGVTIEVLSKRTKFTHPSLQASSPAFSCALIVLNSWSIK